MKSICKREWILFFYQSSDKNSFLALYCSLHQVGRSCTYDQDCIYGMKKCLTVNGNSECVPLQPGNEKHLCDSHYDCPHLNYFCPPDPTGNDKGWFQYCRRQLEEGRKCNSDIECQSDMKCNEAEVPSPRCRRLFSLPLGHLASHDYLCQTGWRNLQSVCVYAAKSKRVGMPCTQGGERRPPVPENTSRQPHANLQVSCSSAQGTKCQPKCETTWEQQWDPKWRPEVKNIRNL